MFNRGLKEEIQTLKSDICRLTKELHKEQKIRTFLTDGDITLNRFLKDFGYFKIREVAELFEKVLNAHNIKFQQTTDCFGIEKGYIIEVGNTGKKYDAPMFQQISDLKHFLLHEFGNLEHILKSSV